MNTIKMRLYLVLAVFMTSNLPVFLFAQKKDSLAILKEFISISNRYKQIPLYVNLEMETNSNFVTGENDTLHVQGEFYLQEKQSYVRFGEFEQVVNDSMALLVSNKLKQMILYINASPVLEKMKSILGAPLPDSSIKNLGAKYKATASPLSKGTGLILLESRMPLYGTSLPKETIELQYDSKEKQPRQVLTTKRNLVLLDSVQYYSFKTQEEFEGKLLLLENSYFLIKELVTKFTYNKIEQTAVATIPVTIHDRIMKNGEGNFIPVVKFENYMLSQEQ